MGRLGEVRSHLIIPDIKDWLLIAFSYDEGPLGVRDVCWNTDDAVSGAASQEGVGHGQGGYAPDEGDHERTR